MLELYVHPHALKHGLTEADVIYAWSNYVRMRGRTLSDSSQMVAIGYDESGRLVQMVGVLKPHGILIFHAMTPPTRKVLAELGLIGVGHERF